MCKKAGNKSAAKEVASAAQRETGSKVAGSLKNQCCSTGQ
jgi:hypothetical protein